MYQNITRSKVMSHYQIVIPKEVRERMDVDVGDSIVWRIEKGRIIVEGEEIPSLQDIIGIGKTRERTDAVKLKKRAQRGMD